MGIKAEKIHTQVLTNDTFTFVADMGIRIVSMVLVSGIGEFVGTLSIGSNTSTPIPLEVGKSVTLGSDSSFAALDGVTIDSTGGGIIHFIARQ